jgi:hypothetical protein
MACQRLRAAALSGPCDGVEYAERARAASAARCCRGGIPRQITGIEDQHPGPIRSGDGYDAVIIVVFGQELRVESAVRVPREVVNELFARSAHVNGRIIQLGHPCSMTPASSGSRFPTPRWKAEPEARAGERIGRMSSTVAGSGPRTPDASPTPCTGGRARCAGSGRAAARSGLRRWARPGGSGWRASSERTRSTRSRCRSPAVCL